MSHDCCTALFAASVSESESKDCDSDTDADLSNTPDLHSSRVWPRVSRVVTYLLDENHTQK